MVADTCFTAASPLAKIPLEWIWLHQQRRAKRIARNRFFITGPGPHFLGVLANTNLYVKYIRALFIKYIMSGFGYCYRSKEKIRFFFFCRARPSHFSVLLFNSPSLLSPNSDLLTCWNLTQKHVFLQNFSSSHLPLPLTIDATCTSAKPKHHKNILFIEEYNEWCTMNVRFTINVILLFLIVRNIICGHNSLEMIFQTVL